MAVFVLGGVLPAQGGGPQTHGTAAPPGVPGAGLDGPALALSLIHILTPARTKDGGHCEEVRPVESIISAILAGAVTLIGVLIANSRSQAVTDTKLEVGTRADLSNKKQSLARQRQYERKSH